MRSLLLATVALFMASPAFALPSIGLGDTLNVVGNATFDGVAVTNTPLDYSPFTNLSNLFIASGSRRRSGRWN